MIKINNKEFLYSFSQNRTYEECPMKYFFKYHEGLKEPSNENLELGTAVHKLLELQWWSVNQDNYFELDRAAYDDAIAAEKVIIAQKGKMYLYKLLEEMANFFKDKEILYSEYSITLEECICKIDLVYRKKDEPNKIVLADYKVTKKPKSTLEMYSEGQLMLYKFAFMNNTDLSSDDILLQYINVLPYNSFKIVEPSELVPIDKTACESFYKGMLQNMDKINALQFPKKKKWCNWCPFRTECDAK